jgi:hypothetical protein
MTASSTPNLGLMLPVVADPFTSDDFRDTFTKLDNAPGVSVIPNQASRPTGLSTLQHGRMYWQADLNVMWIWNQPTSIVAGAWVRLGGFGLLATASNPTQINSTSINWTTAPVAVSLSAMVPGGRPCLVMYNWQYVANDHSRQVTINMVENSSSQLERRHTGSSFGINTGLPPWASSYFYIRPAQATQQSVTFQLRIRAQDPALVGADQGGGTSSIWQPTLSVFEL